MDRLILLALPAAFRERHGNELHDILAASSRPIRDRADVIIAGIGLRLGRAIPGLLAAAVSATIGFAFAVAYAARNLRDGPIEVPDHWWSSLLAAGFVCSATTTIALGLAHRRAAAWRRPH